LSVSDGRAVSTDPVTEFSTALAGAGIPCSGEILADGHLHRYRTDGDRQRNCWYVLHLDGVAAGAFGCWKRGLRENWCSHAQDKLSAQQRKELKRKIADAEQQRKAEEERSHAKAKKAAAWIWARAKPCDSHPYLSAKRVRSHGLRVQEQYGTLVVPLRDTADELWSLQFIGPEGEKRYLTDGGVRGHYHAIGKPNGILYVVEGYATAATIHEITGEAVAMAGFCGNLLSVAEALKGKLTDSKLVICADDDQWTAGNPGVREATEAARALGAALAVPTFQDTSTKPTDFNDLRRLEGPEVVKAQLAAASDPQGIGPGALLYETKAEGRRVIESLAAEIVSRALTGQLAWDPQAQSWLLWSGAHWEPLTVAAPAEKLLADAVHVGTEPIGFRPSYLDGITRLICRRDLLPAPEPPADTVPFSNGLLSIATRELTPATPLRAHRWCLPHAYSAAASCPTIHAWLLRSVGGDTETVELLRAWMAALIRGIPLQKLLILLGPGGTGKGVFQRLATALIGVQNTAVTKLRDLEENRFETAKLFGKRLCMVNEAGRYGGAINILKAITGGDHIPLERKHVQQSGSFVFEGLVLMASNDQVATTDVTSGLERRRLTVEFRRRATLAEKANWERRGGETAVLHREIPGLINWLLVLSTDEIHRRIEEPPRSVRASNLLGMAAGNSVADWLMESCVPAKDAWTQIGQKAELRHRDTGLVYYEFADSRLYPHYLTWCRRTGRDKPLALKRFRDTVVDIAETLGHKVTGGQQPETKKSGITGLRLRPDHENVYEWLAETRREGGESSDTSRREGCGRDGGMEQARTAQGAGRDGGDPGQDFGQKNSADDAYVEGEL
jgi:putative DNA primase/helicase